MQKRVYVSASSREMDRVQGIMGQIAVTTGLTNSHDWTKSFSGPNVPRVSEDMLDPRMRRQFADADILGVMRADYFWLLAPGRKEVLLPQTDQGDLLAPAPVELFSTKGAWVELGSAEMHRRLRGSPIIIVSGSERFQSIFTEIADFFFETDRLALDWLKEQVQ